MAESIIELAQSRQLFAQSGMALAIKRNHGRPAPFLHTHDFTELVVVFSGSGIHVAEGQEYPIRAGDVFVINPGQNHGYRQADSVELVNVIFDLDQLRLDLTELASIPGFHVLFNLEPRSRARHAFESHLQLNVDELTYIRTPILAMERELRERPEGYRLVCTANLILLLARLSRLYSRMQSASSVELMRIGRVLAHIEAHSDRPLSIAELTTLCGMSESTLLRSFKSVFGISPQQYLIRYRIQKGIDLLQQTAEPVSDIAQRVGFCDGSYFARQFKQIVGVSPREYRQRLQV